MTQQQWEPGQAAWSSEKGNVLRIQDGRWLSKDWVSHWTDDEVGTLDPLVRKSEAERLVLAEYDPVFREDLAAAEERGRTLGYEAGSGDGYLRGLVERDAVLTSLREWAEWRRDEGTPSAKEAARQVLAILDGTDQ